MEPEIKLFRFEKSDGNFVELPEEKKQEEIQNIRNGIGFAKKVLTTGECDLLILDDLGTEMTTAFVQSALYQLLNSRLLAGRSTIISTNLDPDQIGRRYSAQIMSRLEGEFELLPFIGQDIRRLKREQQR